jgi:hypothetical protein
MKKYLVFAILICTVLVACTSEKEKTNYTATEKKVDVKKVEPNKQAVEEPKAEEKVEPVTTTPLQLWKDFSDNIETAKTKYQYKDIIISGKVLWKKTYTSNDPTLSSFSASNKYTIAFDAGKTDSRANIILCYIYEEGDFNKIKEKSKVKLTCRLDDYSLGFGYILLSICKIVK